MFWVDTAEGEQKLFDSELLRRILGFTYGMRPWVILALLTAPLLSVVQLARPYVLKLAVDNAIVPGDLAQLWVYVGMFLLVLGAELGGMFAQLILLQWIGQTVLLRLRAALYRKVLRLDHGFYHRTPTGTILTRLTNDLEAIQELFASGIVTLITDVVKLVGIMGVMLWMNWRLALITFGVLPILYAVSDFFRRRLRVFYREVRKYVAHVNAQLSLTVDGIEDLQAMHMEDDLRDRFSEVNDGHRQANLNSIFNDAVLYASVEMLSSIVIGGLIWFGAGQYLEGTVTLGVLIAFIEYVQMFFVPIRDLSAKYAVLQSAFASSEKVFSVLDEEPRIELAERPIRPEREGRVVADGVDFAYEPKNPVLREVSFRAPAKSFLAVVGPTGHGKSTIGRLVRRYYDVDAGSIAVDDHDVRDWDLASLRRRTLAVEQRTFLFAGSVRENLCLTDGYTDDQLLAALDQVGLKDRWHADSADALAMAIDEGGRNLSLGEQQLLALARVLLRDPEIMLLDEATAHIDSATEAALYRTLRREHGARTMIVVAHRLSTIREADEILLVRHGRIEARGRHEELMERSSVYADLVRLNTLESEHGFDDTPA